jgi:carboxylesterase
MKNLVYLALFFGFLFASCSKEGKMPPIDEAVDLDGALVNDSSLTHPENYLLSAAIPFPGSLDLEKPVVICAHGFSATTFEWLEFRDFAKGDNEFYTSLVLLGGHGRDYNDFKESTWEIWQESIIDEYELLRSKGYKNISFAGSSTGCPLILDAITEGKINPDVLKHIYLIDPIVTPSNKTLTLVSVVGPMLSYSEIDMNPEENGFWYKYWPYQPLKQLNKFTKLTRKRLQKGLTLPAGVDLTVYKSEKDGTADPLSAVLLKEGLKLNNGNSITVKMIESDLHVFTRLKGRIDLLPVDQQNQLNTFNEIKNAL